MDIALGVIVRRQTYGYLPGQRALNWDWDCHFPLPVFISRHMWARDGNRSGRPPPVACRVGSTLDGRCVTGRPHKMQSGHFLSTNLKLKFIYYKSLRFFIFFIWFNVDFMIFINITLCYCSVYCFFLFVVAISDLNVVILPVSRPVKSRQFSPVNQPVQQKGYRSGRVTKISTGSVSDVSWSGSLLT